MPWAWGGVCAGESPAQGWCLTCHIGTGCKSILQCTNLVSVLPSLCWLLTLTQPISSVSAIFKPLYFRLGAAFPMVTLTAWSLLLREIVLPSVGSSSSRDRGELRASSTGIVLFRVALWHFLKHGKLSATATRSQECIPRAGFRAWDWGWDGQERAWWFSRLGEAFN